MINTGQIIEIPSTSSIYAEDHTVFSSKRDELLRHSAKRDYGLFDGFLVGEHQGTGAFRLGQRKGINVGGKAAPLYVIGINDSTNQLFVGQGEDHPGLWTAVVRLPASAEALAMQSAPGLMETGLEVSIHSAVTDIDMIATFYLFGKVIFLEFAAPVPIAMQDHPLEIYFDGHSHPAIKIIK